MKEFIEISKYAGMREDLVQAGGGNTSYKLDNERMVIKASGVQLAEVSDKGGYSIVNYRMLRQYLDELILERQNLSESEILNKALIEGSRPSIETFLHAVTGNLSLHTHSIAVNVMTSRTDGMQQLKKIFPEALLVGYATPGIELAKLYYKKFIQTSCSTGLSYPVIFLKNHGVIVSGSTAGEVIRRSEEVNCKIESIVNLDCSAYRKAYDLYCAFRLLGLDDGKIVVKVENKGVLETFKKFGYKLWKYQFSPDCLVFCGKAPLLYQESFGKKELQRFLYEKGEPVIIQWKRDLFIRANSIKKVREIESILAFTAQVAWCNQNESMDYLAAEEQDFLLSWDAENYRRQMR